MDDLDLHLALEALRTNPAAHAYHERITRGMQAIEQGTLTPFERDALHRLLARFPISPPADPVAALIAAFQHELPQHDPAAVATAIQHALAQQPATLNGAPVTITMNGDTHAHQANLAIGNQVGGHLVQVTVTIPIPDARFDALLASALRTHEQEKTLARIQHAAQQIESDRLLNLRQQGFVGRVNELAAIREHIEAMRPTGGYVLIKAAAGEGKSSSIAKLIQEAGITQTPHHFIALTTGREYQLGLLRAVVAQLVLKHGLTVSYFPEESYPAMKAEFARILDELSKQGIAETIYLDGLDQLQPEIDGTRDLSFLPPQPSPGIVIVLGSRPDETLKPLEILHRVDYALPPLSEADALALWRSVQPGVADGLLNDLYTALKGNALFVYLAADTMQGQSLVDATSLIRQIEQNPSNLFGITLDRMKGRSRSQWDSVWKPMLALLLVAQEPLRLDVLGDLLGHDNDTMQDAVWVLGGLVSQGTDHRVALHHLLFRDYLEAVVFAAREVKRWHQRLADWCATDVDAIWVDHADTMEQARRVYARHHYITHLALAENWTILWRVLDTGDYGEHKTQFDPSTRLYALDLDRGRESAIKAGQSTEEHIQNLPRLWKYSLLRTSLSSRIDQWPDELFVAFAMMGRTQEALECIESVSDPHRQVLLWEGIIPWCDKQQGHNILIRMYQLMNQLSGLGASNLLRAIAETTATLGNINNALAIAQTIDDAKKRTAALTAIAQTTATLGDSNSAKNLLDEAFTIAQTIDNSPIHTTRKLTDDFEWHITPLTKIAQITASLGDIDSAITIAQTMDSAVFRSAALTAIAGIAVTLGYNDRARELLNDTITVVQMIDDASYRTNALTEIVQVMATLGDSDRARKLLNDALTITQTMDDNDLQITDILTLIAQTTATLGDIDHALTIVEMMKDHKYRTDGYRLLIASINCTAALRKIAQAAANFGHIDHALIIADTIYPAQDRAVALIWIARAAATIGDYGHAISILDAAITIAQTVVNNSQRTDTLSTIAQTMTTLGDTTRAIAIAQTMDNTDTFSQRTKILTIIAKTIATLGDTTRAIAIVLTMDDTTKRTHALTAITETMAIIGQIKQARKLLNNAITIAQTIDDAKEYTATITAIARSMIILGKNSQAKKLLDNALTSAKEIDKTFSQHTNAITAIAQTMATLGYSNQAKKLLENELTIVQTLNNNFSQRDDAIREIAETMAILNDTERAVNIAQLIDDILLRNYALGAIVKITATMGNINRALAIVQLIEGTSFHCTALGEIAEITATLGNTNNALTIAQTINDVKTRIDAFIAIAHTMATMGDRNQAKKLLDTTLAITTTIDHKWGCADSLCAIAEGMAFLGDTTYALTVAQMINHAMKRTEAFITIIQIIQLDTSILSLIHEEWLFSKTHDITWKCLALITPLLRDHPWLIEQILEDEKWVNDQLKRLG